MTVKVTFEFDTNAEAAEFLQSLDADAGASEAGAEAKPKGRGRPRKAADAPVATALAAQPTVAAAPATTAPALVPYDALKKPLTDLADVNHEAAVAILASFGVKQARELKDTQIGPCLAKVQAALTKAQSAPAGLL